MLWDCIAQVLGASDSSGHRSLSSVPFSNFLKALWAFFATAFAFAGSWNHKVLAAAKNAGNKKSLHHQTLPGDVNIYTWSSSGWNMATLHESMVAQIESPDCPCLINKFPQNPTLLLQFHFFLTKVCVSVVKFEIIQVLNDWIAGVCYLHPPFVVIFSQFL